MDAKELAMIETSHGIILRTRLLTETSLIVHWLTPESGRLATVARGARRPKSPFAGKLDLFYSADFSFRRSRRSELHQLREVRLHATHTAVRHDLAKLQAASYAVAFVELATETQTPLPEVFELTRRLLQELCVQKATVATVLGFELKTLNALGLLPEPAAARLTPGATKIVQMLRPADDDHPPRLQISPAQKTELHEWLRGLLTLHLGREPRGRAAALAGVD